MRRGLAFVSVLVIAPATASAGRTFYGWLWGTEVLPERGAELMSFVSEQNHQETDVPDPADPTKTIAQYSSETRWWIGPLIGITDQLELAVPLEIAWGRTDGQPGHTAFDRYGAELRYRFVTQDPVDAPPLVPLVRVAVERSVTERATTIPQADVVVSYDEGIVQVLADVGAYAELSGSRQHFEIHPGAGVSVEVMPQLRFGAEVHAELTLDDGSSWAVAGPNMSWSHGRSWLTAMYGIGFYGVRDAPRLLWGIAF